MRFSVHSLNDEKMKLNTEITNEKVINQVFRKLEKSTNIKTLNYCKNLCKMHFDGVFERIAITIEKDNTLKFWVFFRVPIAVFDASKEKFRKVSFSNNNSQIIAYR